MKGWLAITLGDVTGIGPEVTLKALAAELSADNTKYLLIGDSAWLEACHRSLNSPVALQPFTGYQAPGRVFTYSPGPPLGSKLEPGSPESAQAAVAALREAAQRCLRGETDAVITAPVSKEAIIRAGVPFVGQTELLSQIAGTKQTIMMLLGTDERGRWLRVSLATTHLPLKSVPGQLTTEKVKLAIERSIQACRDLDLTQARIGVCGLNPHAGEGGNMGTEEIDVIAPAIREVRLKRGGQIEGPFPADTLFHFALRGDFDVVVAMYHDQGLAPLKMIAFDSGVNWTLGLPFIRTSPDHGTAFAIAGKDAANPSSMLAALRLAKKLAAKQAKEIP